MTAAGHYLIGGAFALPAVLLGHTGLAMGLLIGSNLPDQLELSYYSKIADRAFRVIPHRTITHYPWIWFAFLYLAINYPQTQLPGYQYLWPAVVGVIVSGLLHIAADMCSPSGIPLLNPFGKRFSLTIYRTGRDEWRVLMPVAAVSALICYPLFQGAPWLV